MLRYFVLLLLFLSLGILDHGAASGPEVFSANNHDMMLSTTSVTENVAFDQLQQEVVEVRQEADVESMDLSFDNTMFFIQNKGQLDNHEVLYYMPVGTGYVGFGESKIIFHLYSQESANFDSYAVEYPGAQLLNPQPADEQVTLVNYFKGGQAFTNLQTWKSISYPQLYDGIDLKYYISPYGLKYDFIVQPFADPDQIVLSTDTQVQVSTDALKVDYFNEDQFMGSDEELLVYQSIAGQDDILIDAKFEKVSHGSYTFDLAAYDTSNTLVIDPLVLSFSSYFGASGGDGMDGDMVQDSDGSVVITGNVQATGDLQLVENPYLGVQNGDVDFFVLKISPQNQVQFVTYFGGSGFDGALGMDIGFNRIYLTGITNSGDYPTNSAYNVTKSPDLDAFVTVLNEFGNVSIYSSFFGGEKVDFGEAIVVSNGPNDFYVLGGSNSPNLPTTANAFDPTHNGDFDMYYMQMNVFGGLVYSTYLGGGGNETPKDLTFQGLGSSFVFVGTTTSTDMYPQRSGNYNGGNTDLVVGYFSYTSLWTIKYFGGNGTDEAYEVKKDDRGNAYIVGRTDSLDFPVQGGYQNSPSGDYDGFIAKFAIDGMRLTASTLFGGSFEDRIQDVDFDENSNVIITGSTSSDDLPMFNAEDDSYNGATTEFSTSADVLVASFDEGLQNLRFSSYFGTTGSESGEAVVVNGTTVWVAGQTGATDLPLLNEFDADSENGEAFVAKWDMSSLSQDSSAPIIQLVDLEDDSNILPESNVSLTISDEISGVKQTFVAWNDDEASLFTESSILSPKENGPATLHVRTQDVGGNWATQEFDFLIDGAPPVVTVTGIRNGDTVLNDILINVDVEDDSELQLVRYYINNEAVYETKSARSTFSASSWDYEDGTIVVRIEVVDILGNEYIEDISITIEDRILGMTIETAIIVASTALIPVLTLLLRRIRSRSLYRMYLDKEMSIEEIAKKKRKSQRKIEYLLRKHDLL